MNPFTQTYILLFLILFGGIAGSLVTPFGGDPRIGNISAGVSIGVLIAIFVTRVAQLRFNEDSSLAPVDFHSKLTSMSDDADRENGESQSFHIVEVDRADQAPELPKETVVESVVPVKEPEMSVVEPVVAAAVPAELRCSCVCDCRREAKSGFEGLCGECRTSRLQELLLCNCDYSSTPVCVCGALNHWPGTAESDIDIAS